jgi:hypothetical protein
MLRYMSLIARCVHELVMHDGYLLSQPCVTRLQVERCAFATLVLFTGDRYLPS